MHRTDKYSQHSSIIGPVRLNGWVFVYELNGCWFVSCCSHLNFRYGTCFEQEVPWHSGKYRVLECVWPFCGVDAWVCLTILWGWRLKAQILWTQANIVIVTWIKRLIIDLSLISRIELILLVDITYIASVTLEKAALRDYGIAHWNTFFSHRPCLFVMPAGKKYPYLELIWWSFSFRMSRNRERHLSERRRIHEKWSRLPWWVSKQEGNEAWIKKRQTQKNVSSSPSKIFIFTNQKNSDLPNPVMMNSSLIFHYLTPMTQVIQEHLMT